MDRTFWPRRRSRSARPTTTPGLQPIDAWLDTVHRLAQTRAAEREGLASADRDLRARLGRTE